MSIKLIKFMLQFELIIQIISIIYIYNNKFINN